jgi:hypothetical protein
MGGGGDGDRHTDTGTDTGTAIDGYTQTEDDKLDEAYTLYGECHDCGGPADVAMGCLCDVADWDMENFIMRDPTRPELYANYRYQADVCNSARRERQRKRQRLRCTAAWQRVGRVVCLVRYWGELAVVPDSLAFQAAAKRFKRMTGESM